MNVMYIVYCSSNRKDMVVGRSAFGGVVSGQKPSLRFAQAVAHKVWM